jgi:hypothetical protein
MTDPIALAIIVSTSLVAVMVAATFALKGWQGWLDLKRLELAAPVEERAYPVTGNKIELADLKERVRKLEAIAAGIDL